MTKAILAASLITLALAPIAQAESTNIYGSHDHKYIFTTTDDGDCRSSSAQRISDNTWIVTDQDGRSRRVTDYSDMGDDRDSDSE